MATSKSTSNNHIQAAQRECKLRRFVKCGANWYRLHGQNLLQVVTFNGLPQRTTDVSYQNRPTVSFVVFSLYEQIPWINVPVMRAKRDIIPNISASVFAHQSAGAPFLGPECEAKYMIDTVFPFLDELNSHMQLADLLEHLDCWEYGKIRLNDRKKIIPYLLSGKWQQVLRTIDAIEDQNRRAYQENCKTVTGYDPLFQEKKINKHLEQLIMLRDNIAEHNEPAIVDLLSSNYKNNIQRLKEMGVTGPESFSPDYDYLNRIFHEQVMD